MIPMRTSSIFKSRWMALIWAAGIIWLALDVAGGKQGAATNTAANNEIAATDIAGEPVTNEDEQKVADALGL
jgi:cytochrome oxidase Cu insertion factor (SCO1/SenC/PrrC family)